jgi:hypothetical protein
MKLSRSLYTLSGNSDRCLVREIRSWLSESTLTLYFPFRRRKKARFQVFFGSWVVSELKISAYHFFMEEIRSVYRVF